VRVPAILDLKVWKAIQAKLDAKATRKGTRTRKDTAFLTSIIYCEQGHPLYRTHTWDGKLSYYERHGCRPGLMLDLEETDKAVLDAIEWMGDESGGPKVIERTIRVPGSNWDNEIALLAEEIRDLNPLADDWMEKVAAIRAEIAELQARPAVPDHDEIELVSWLDFMSEWNKMGMGARREFLLAHGFKVIASKGGLRITTH
jgi:hypothetical protein